MKVTGKRSAGKPHAPFDEAGAGNRTTAAGMRPRVKAMEKPPEPTGFAPVLDPTRRRAHQGGIAERKEMIDSAHDLPVQQQAKVLGISRSTVYYEPRPIPAEDLWLMRRIDELHLNYPFAGSRMLRDLLWQQGLVVGRRHIKTLMRKMGIEAIYRKPNTSKPAPGHRIYPYLLRNLTVLRPNQVWAMDITYSTPSQRISAERRCAA